MACEPGERSGSNQRLDGAGFALPDWMSRRRFALTVAISLLVATEVLFWPMPDDVPAFETDAWFALGHVIRCLFLGMVIMLTLTFAEAVSRRWARWPAFVFYSASLFAGAVGGSLLMALLQGQGLGALEARRFWADAALWIAIGHGNATIHFIQQRGLRAADQMHQAQIRGIALGKQMLEARLHLLHAQIEPHFLFNALANVRRLCHDDVESGVSMIRNIALCLRAALPRMRDAPATLGQEADLVSAYLGILAVRMGDRLRYVVDVPEFLSEHPFPPMMVLTLAENAIRHGVGPVPQGGSITIRARVIGRRLEISVADDGVGFAAAPTSGTGIGLANTRARLAALHGDAGVLVLEPNLPSGVVVTIRMPYAWQFAVDPLPAHT
jgi:signal transduction histidine kinase